MFRSLRNLLCAGVIFIFPAAAASQTQTADPARSVEADVKLALRDAQRIGENDLSWARSIGSRNCSRSSNPIAYCPRIAGRNWSASSKTRFASSRPGRSSQPIPAMWPLAPAAAKRVEEFAKVRAGVREAALLAKQGKVAEANAKATDLMKQFPDSIAVQVLADINQATAKRDQVHAVRKEKEQGALTTLAGVDRSAVMPKDEIVYPKDFKEKTAKRLADTAPTAEELRTLKALNSEITPKFNGSRLEDVIDYLSTVTGLPILIDKASLDDLGINYDTKVTLALKRPVAVRTVLRAVLRQVGLTFVARDGVVYAATQVRAREYLVTKVYTVADLVHFPWTHWTR